ncbi:Nedd4 e3 ubiquitin-protein ligase wwp1, partial [Globisporangium splendens]
MEGQRLLLEVGGSCLVLWAIAAGLYLCMVRVSRPTPREIELRAPLVATAKCVVHDMSPNSYQEDAELIACLEAEDGYNACTTCGFENFKRFPFCSLCGDEIVAWKQYKEAKDAAVMAKEKQSFWSVRTLRSAVQKTTKVEILNAQEQQQQSWAISTQRQQRVRKRKEWTRKLDPEGKLFWYRDTTGSAPDAFFPGYTVTYQNLSEEHGAKREKTGIPDAETITVVIEAASDPTSNRPRLGGNGVPEINEAMESPRGIQLSRQDREEDLNREIGAIAMDLVDSSLADPGRLPILRSSNNRTAQNVVHWRDALSLSAQPFPDKYAHFVTTTAALITPAECEIIKLNVKREQIFEDSIESLSVIPLRSVRSVMRINFVAEAGVDAGGLHREWFVLLNECLADPTTGVFHCTNQHEQTFSLSANSREHLGENHLVYFFATGRLIGRALLEGSVIGFHLSLPLIKIILGLPVTFSDLEYFDPETYKSLLWMLENDDVGALGLDFSVTEKRGEEVVVVDLIPNGCSIDVTDDNKDEYVERRFRYMLFESVSSQLYAFLKGLYEVIPQELLMLFDPEEFDYLLCGSDEIDVDDWERNAKYSNIAYDHPALLWFWELVREMPNEYRQRLLHFATGSSRVPIAGFSSLTSYDGRLCPFTLNGVPLVNDGYIWSHACFNRLDLPYHVSRDDLKAVLYAALETELYGFTTN